MASCHRSRIVFLMRGWLLVVSAGMVASVLSILISSWIFVDAVSIGNTTDKFYQNVGLWQTCRLGLEYDKSNHTSFHMECSALEQTTVSGSFRIVQLLCTLSSVACCVAAVSLCVLLVYGDTWKGYRKACGLVICITIVLWISAFAEIAGVIFQEYGSNASILPVCVEWCPINVQPSTSCLLSNNSFPGASSCIAQLGPGYFSAVVAAGLQFLGAALGLVVMATVWGCQPWKRFGANSNHDDDLLIASSSVSEINETECDVIIEQRRS